MAAVDLDRQSLSRINADKSCFSENMISYLAFDVAAGRVLTSHQVIGWERKQTEVVVVWSMLFRWTRTTVADPLEVVDCLLEPMLFGVLSGALSERTQSRRKIVGRPMMPHAGRSVRIVA